MHKDYFLRIYYWDEIVNSLFKIILWFTGKNWNLTIYVSVTELSAELFFFIGQLDSSTVME